MENGKEADIPLNDVTEKMTGKEGPTFETILDTIGHFGRSQWIVYGLLTLTDIMNSMIFWYLIFSTATPTWRCVEFDGPVYTSGLNGSVYNYNVTFGDMNNTFEETCEFNGSHCIKYEFEDTFTSISTEWNLVCDMKFVLNLIKSVMMMGLLIGAAIASQVSDLFGRKKLLCVSMILMLITQTMLGFSINWQMYAGLRFFIGMSLAGTMAVTFVMPLEFVGPSRRAICAFGIYDFGTCWAVLVAYLARDWRQQEYTWGVFCVPVLIAIIIFVPESPRWLIQKKRFREASHVITWMARMNRKPVPDLSKLEEVARTQIERSGEERRYTYLDLFANRRLIVTTLTNMFCWFSICNIYYNITFSIGSLSGNMYLNSVLASLAGLFLGWTVVPISHKIGRKRAYVLYAAGPVLSMFCIVILNAFGQLEEKTMAKTALALIGKVFIGETWVMLRMITGEVYPTLMRTIGVGIGNTSARIGGIIAPYIIHLGDIVHWTIPYIVNGCLALATVVLVLVIFKESNKCPLSENLPKKRKLFGQGVTVVETGC